LLASNLIQYCDGPMQAIIPDMVPENKKDWQAESKISWMLLV
jgi:hypothetical protein